MSEAKKMYKQNDHIILPKATLKRFADSKTNKIKYLDLSNPENLSIKEAFPRSFHTKTNFYNPVYDNIVKRYETMIGKYNKSISDICMRNENFKLDEKQMKKDIIDIITIQFDRIVLADDNFLNKLLAQFRENYQTESLSYFRSGSVSKEFLDRKQKFEQASKDINAFRYYAQGIIGQSNEVIQKIYEKFFPCILIVPDESNSSFVLSPQHFVATDTFVRIIISPRIALALYPVKNERIIKYLTKEEVDWLIPRAIESALAINSDFRQIVGEENYLNCIKNKLEKYKSILCNLNDDTILVKGNEVILNDDLECFELLVSIMLFKPNYHKFVMELSAISNEFLHKSEFLHSIEIFKERECYIVFVNNLGLDTSVIQITVAQNNEEAITMF